MAEKRKKMYNFLSDWEELFFERKMCMCHLLCDCGDGKKSIMSRDILVNVIEATMLATHLAAHYGQWKPELKANGSLYSRSWRKNSQKTTEASFRAMMIIAKTVVKDEKNGTEIISTLSNVQLGASMMARRVSATSENLTEQLEQDLATWN